MTDIDVFLDLRSDTPDGQDPDAQSKTLREYHRVLWSKRLPTRARFQLEARGRYLVHRSELGEFTLSSDTAIPDFRREASVAGWTSPLEGAEFSARRYSIGGMIIFPAVQVERAWTINQARGCRGQIKDRFDLTIECIRRHYRGGASPLADALARYDTFFRLFGDFRGYVEFFHLQDIVTHDLEAVRFALPCEDFERSPVPRSRDEYQEYRSASLSFIDARGQRMRLATQGGII